MLAWYRLSHAKTLQVDVASRSFHARGSNQSRRHELGPRGDLRFTASSSRRIGPRATVDRNKHGRCIDPQEESALERSLFLRARPVEEYLRDMYGNWSMVYLNT